MPKLLLSLVFIYLIQSLSLAQTKEFGIDKIVEFEQKTKYKKLEKSFSLAPTANYDLNYSEIFIHPDTAKARLYGEVKHLFRLNTPSPTISFDLNDSLKVNYVLWRNNFLPFTQSKNILTASFPYTLPISTDSVKINYVGFTQSSGFGSYALQKHGADSIISIWTLSQPYGARDWMPCKMTLDDKLDSVKILLEVPQGFMGVSNGLLKKVQQTGRGNLIYQWEHKYPIANYLIAFAVSNYDTIVRSVKLKNDSLPIVCYVYPESKTEWEQDVRNVTSIMILFDSLFEGYPYASEYYGETQFGWGGGMEHQTNSFMYNLWFELVAHELAHQWFGDKVTCGSWSDIWLNEGFATYGSGIAYEHLEPIYFKPYLQTIGRRARNATKGSIWVDDTTKVSRIFSGQLSYSKAAYVLHMLRWHIGDSLFFRSINDLHKEFANSFINTNNFQNIVERNTGKDLSYFFDQWIYGSGYPHYTLLWSKEKEQITIKLIQQTTDSIVSPFFNLKVPIQIYSNNEVAETVLEHNENGQVFTINFPKSFDSIGIDFNLKLLIGNKNVYKLDNVESKYSWSFHPNPAVSKVIVVVDASSLNDIQFKLFDLNGKIVSSFQPNTKNYNYTIPLDGISKGTYLFSLFEKGKIVSSKKIIIN
jgi:aminopeptidase N